MRERYIKWAAVWFYIIAVRPATTCFDLIFQANFQHLAKPSQKQANRPRSSFPG